MAEWEDVSCLTIVEISDNFHEESIIGQASERSSFLSCEELLEHIQEFQVDRNTLIIERTSSHSNLLSCCASLSRNVLSNKQNIEKAKLIRLAGEQFDNCNEFHLKCLFTLYSKLTGDIVKGQRRFGTHWEEIGFQGSDPATDFRGVGLLGLYQLCNFVIDPEDMSLARDVYQLSLNLTQHFPFAVMSMNMTHISLQTLKKSFLNRAIVHSNNKSVYSVFHQFYILIFRKFYHRWMMENKTITDTGYVLKELRENCKKYIKELIQKSNTKEYKFSKSAESFVKQEIEFSNIGTILD